MAGWPWVSKAWATNTSTIRLDANDTLPDGTTVLLYGGTTFNANGKTDTLGTLTTGSSGDTTVTVNLGSGANLTITNNSLPAGMTSGYGNGTIHGKITGTGNITYAHATAIAASAQWDWFNATNDFTGTVTVTQGRLRVASDAVLGNAANDLVFNGTPVATLGNQEGKASFQIASAGNLTLGAGRDIILNTGKEGTMYAWGSYTMTVNGKITGGGNLRKEDGGALLLANTANDYTGLTRIALGTLRVGAAGVIPDASGVEIAGGNLDLVGLTESVASLFGSGGAVNGGGTLTVLTSGSSTYNGVVQGGSTLSMAGGGTQTIAGTVDNDNGWAAVSSGTLVLGKTSGSSVHSVGRTDAVGLWITGGTAQLGGTGNDQIYFRTEVSQSAGVFDLNGRNEGIRGLTGSGGTVNNGAAATTSTLTVGESTSASNTFTYSGAIEDGAGQVALTKSGDGTQVLDGTSNYTGSTTVNGGTLRVQGTLGATATTVSATLPATARISGNGSLGGSLTLGVGGGFGVRIADWTGAPGTGFEDLAVASLAIASGAHTITVDASGLANFSETTKAFPFLLTLSGISGFNPADFTISAPGFTGTGTWTVQTNGNNLELVYTVLSNAYDDWATAKGLDGSNNGKGQDPDGDGRTNLQEFAFDGDPLSAVNDGKTVVKMVDLDGAGPEGQALVLVLPVRDSAVFSGPGDLVSAALDGVIYKIQGSDDLLDFTSMDVTEASDQSAGMPALSSGWTYRTFRTPGSVSDPDPGDFLRAMVQEGP